MAWPQNLVSHVLHLTPEEVVLGCSKEDPESRVAAQPFSYRVPLVWNKLPLTIATSSSLSVFKRLLKTH